MQDTIYTGKVVLQVFFTELNVNSLQILDIVYPMCNVLTYGQSSGNRRNAPDLVIQGFLRLCIVIEWDTFRLEIELDSECCHSEY